MLSLRKAIAADIPLIRQLTFAIWPQTYSSIIGQQQIDYMLDMMYNPATLQKQMEEDGGTFIIVYDENEPIAFASYAPLTEPCGHPADNETESKIWKLNKIYILPSKQGKGTGKFIIRYIVDEIKTRHGKALQLQVNRENKAKYFYEKLGFKIIQTADFDIGNGYFMNDYIMELPILD
jgi:GNAT superfamily N-acetyltransferase